MVLFASSFLAAAMIAFVLTWNVREVACRRGLAIGPTSDRHVHKRPIPRLGGVAIYTTFVVVGITSFLLGTFPENRAFSSHRTMLFLLIGATMVFLLGLADDYKPVRPWTKLIVQSAAAVVLFFGGMRVLSVPLLTGAHPLWGLAALGATIFWVVLVTNAFNLLDGLDGLAAGSALFATLTVFFVSLATHNELVALLSLVLGGTILGFLRFNFHPASIFLGDSGSLLMGFLLSAFALSGGQQKGPTAVAIAIPIVAFGIPILETVLSTARRIMSGKPVFSADREHIHHKLLGRGFSQRQAVLLLYGASGACGMLSVSLLYTGHGYVPLVLFVLAVGVIVGIQNLGYHEVVELARVARRTIEQRQIIQNNLSIRRATEELTTTSDRIRICKILESAFRDSDFDGFEYHVSVDSGVADADDIHHEWTREECTRFWSLVLHLSAPGLRQASLTVHRSSNRSLMMDINLLTADFATELGRASARATSAQRVSRSTGRAAAAVTSD